MQTNQLLVAIQQLTVEEFCLEYCGNTQVFLNQQNKKRMNQDSLGKFRKRYSIDGRGSASMCLYVKTCVFYYY
jgi:hypothetical protein